MRLIHLVIIITFISRRSYIGALKGDPQLDVDDGKLKEEAMSLVKEEVRLKDEAMLLAKEEVRLKEEIILK